MKQYKSRYYNDPTKCDTARRKAPIMTSIYEKHPSMQTFLTYRCHLVSNYPSCINATAFQRFPSNLFFEYRTLSHIITIGGLEMIRFSNLGIKFQNNMESVFVSNCLFGDFSGRFSCKIIIRIVREWIFWNYGWFKLSRITWRCVWGIVRWNLPEKYCSIWVFLRQYAKNMQGYSMCSTLFS